ncbi:MAG: hypothetical protein U0U66_14265 [Cytophagaceae bacterium]
MTQEPFGKNRVQYKSFDWKYITTHDFEVYYYMGGEGLAPHAITQAEAVFDRLSRATGYSSIHKTKIIIYNSIQDLQQSNIGLEQGTYLGGKTNLVKAVVEVAFTGDYEVFKKDLTFGIAKTWIMVNLYGGSFKEVLQSSYFLSLPDWYIDGAARYMAEGWSQEMDNYIRDLALNNKLNNPASYSGKQAQLIGQSIWHYISEKYGRDMMTSIIQITHIYRSERASMEGALNRYYSDVMQDWRTYYTDKALRFEEQQALRLQAERISKHWNKSLYFSSPSISKEGSYSAYSANVKGKFKVIIKNTKTGKKKTIVTGGYKLNDQTFILKNPILGWQNDNTLGIAVVKRGKIFFILYNVETNKKESRVIEVFQQVNSFSFNANGEFIAFSADEKGQSDIWLYDLKRSRYQQITNDEYDDLEPSWGPNNEVIFSSNRADDTITTTRFQSEEYRSLFVYKSGNKILTRISGSDENLRQPKYINKETIVYLSDKSGVSELYKRNLSTNSIERISSEMTDIESYDWNVQSNYLIWSCLNKGKSNVFFYNTFTGVSVKDSIVYTARVESKIIADKKAYDVKNTGNEFISIPIKVKEEDGIDLDKVYFESDTAKKPKQKNIVATGTNSTTTTTNTNWLALAKNRRKLSPFYGPYGYKHLFGTDNFATTLQIDPLRGFGLLMESNMSDMMSNHRVNMGLFGLMDFKSSSLFGEYKYLKKRTDFGVRFDRITYAANSTDVSQKYHINKFQVTASYPISVYSRISFSPTFINHTATDLSDTRTIAEVPIQKENYLGHYSEFVYDNTTTYGMNMLEGMRGKISLESNWNTGDKDRSFSRFMVDIRRYQKINRGLVLALRGTYGTSFGASPKMFSLGGMDNWFFNSKGDGGEVNPFALTNGDPNMDIMFTKFVTNMRGFKYNTQTGTSYLLASAELRLPIVKYFYSGTVTSTFFRNLQLTTFFDIGAAWTGQSPFNTNNSLNTKNISSPPSFTAVVTNYRNPFLVGYGFGARTMMFGYYVKLDVSWGIQDSQRLNTRYFFTVGYDF